MTKELALLDITQVTDGIELPVALTALRGGDMVTVRPKTDDNLEIVGFWAEPAKAEFGYFDGIALENTAANMPVKVMGKGKLGAGIMPPFAYTPSEGEVSPSLKLLKIQRITKIWVVVQS